MAIELGAVEEWVLENDSDDYHPFHMHVNPFQIVEISDRLIPPGTWLDTVLIPPQRFGVPGRVVMRTRIRRFIVSDGVDAPRRHRCAKVAGVERPL